MTNDSKEKEEVLMKGLITLGVIALALLCVLCPSCRAPAIQEAVGSAALACADEVGLDPGLISVSGRDVTLSGAVASEALSHHLTNCIAAFPGTMQSQYQGITLTRIIILGLAETVRNRRRIRSVRSVFEFLLFPDMIGVIIHRNHN